MRIYLSGPITEVNDYMYKFGDAEEYLEEKYTDALAKDMLIIKEDK